MFLYYSIQIEFSGFSHIRTPTIYQMKDNKSLLPANGKMYQPNPAYKGPCRVVSYCSHVLIINLATKVYADDNPIMNFPQTWQAVDVQTVMDA